MYHHVSSTGGCDAPASRDQYRLKIVRIRQHFSPHSEVWDRVLCIVYRLYDSVVSSVCVINMRHYRDTINLGKWGETETREAGAGGWNKYTQLFIYLELQQSRGTCSQLAQVVFVHFSSTKYVWSPICKYFWHSVPHLTYWACYHVSTEHAPYNDYKCWVEDARSWAIGKMGRGRRYCWCPLCPPLPLCWGGEQSDTSSVGFLNFDIGTVLWWIHYIWRNRPTSC